MFSLKDSRPATGTWVFWVTVEQATGRMAQGLNLWNQKSENIFAGEEGIELFWSKAENLAQAHLKGQLVERQQQIQEAESHLESLHQITEATAKMLGSIGVEDV